MVKLLPQWRGSGQRDAALSKRSLSVDIGMSDIQMDDVISTVDLLDKFREGTDAYRSTRALSCQGPQRADSDLGSHPADMGLLLVG